MCCCGTPTKNGEPGYRWQPNDAPSVRPVYAPPMEADYVLLHDEPGRCVRGLDSHSHHYRLVKRSSIMYLLVHHGGGDERIRLTAQTGIREALDALDSDARYLLLNTLYHTHSDAKRQGSEAEGYRWREAIVNKRVKTRKVRGQSTVKVWIEEAP